MKRSGRRGRRRRRKVEKRRNKRLETFCNIIEVIGLPLLRQLPLSKQALQTKCGELDLELEQDAWLWSLSNLEGLEAKERER